MPNINTNAKYHIKYHTNPNANMAADAAKAKVAQRRAPHEGDMGSNPIFSMIASHVISRGALFELL